MGYQFGHYRWPRAFTLKHHRYKLVADHQIAHVKVGEHLFPVALVVDKDLSHLSADISPHPKQIPQKRPTLGNTCLLLLHAERQAV